ncbi:fructosamine kinase family protein [Couchioplanes caeruleus]|uniref:fructosamine kinase family protein n=1 Tax=Couchioplanes caeruleus TaxID=56438 RepID=UPI0020BFE5CC|nr:fructosamine kinase family protein [Couchioplanes caeruleus]UQU65023.1 fructosamine kinase family protein [Couchioplanes caeruleus]
MDLPYLRAHPQHLPTFLTHQRIRETPVGGGHVCTASRLTLDDGFSLFAKTWPSGRPPEHFFGAEAAGLSWLREAGTVPIPEVFVAMDEMLALEWVEPGSATAAAAERFGRDLAGMHRAGADSFGASWPGFIGPLQQDNTPSEGPWGSWFGERRLRPYLRMSADQGALSPDDVAAVDRIIERIDSYGGDERPARLHGDLWPGNVLWAADGRAWLVDPAAHGGHRETDLAQLALFGGAPHLATTLSAYEEVWPLSEGWRDRVALHQLHLLLVHTAAFGAAYRGAVRSAANSVLGG